MPFLTAFILVTSPGRARTNSCRATKEIREHFQPVGPPQEVFAGHRAFVANKLIATLAGIGKRGNIGRRLNMLKGAILTNEPL